MLKKKNGKEKHAHKITHTQIQWNTVEMKN